MVGIVWDGMEFSQWKRGERPRGVTSRKKESRKEAESNKEKEGSEREYKQAGFSGLAPRVLKSSFTRWDAPSFFGISQAKIYTGMGSHAVSDAILFPHYFIVPALKSTWNYEKTFNKKKLCNPLVSGVKCSSRLHLDSLWLLLSVLEESPKFYNEKKIPRNLENALQRGEFSRKNVFLTPTLIIMTKPERNFPTRPPTILSFFSLPPPIFSDSGLSSTRLVP